MCLYVTSMNARKCNPSCVNPNNGGEELSFLCSFYLSLKLMKARITYVINHGCIEGAKETLSPPLKSIKV